MRLIEAIRMAFQMIRAQKLKSFFSLIGVLIGVMFLIAVWSIVSGMNDYVEDRIANRLIGANSFQLRQRPSITTGNITREEWLSWRRRPRVTVADAEYVAARIQTPVRTAKFCQDRVSISYGGKTAKDIDLIGTEPEYFNIRDYAITSGRAFTVQEMRAARPVLVIGDLLAERLFEGVDPIGKAVNVGGIHYRVIGVVEKQGTAFGISMDKFAIMPYTSQGRRLICPINVLDELLVKADNPTSMVVAMNEVEALMRGRRRLKPDQENNFFLQTAEGALEGWNKVSQYLSIGLPLLVGISLVVGGIVIMNIMLMSVTERTREIGIRKALGAKRSDILSQFLVEAATVSTVGAAFGIVLGIALAMVVRALSPLPAVVVPMSIALGVSLGMLVGIVAGVYPAYRAAKLDPIVALRAE
ncbi:MAG TPA: ABC transporter permease [Gemmatimonadales bacterium]|nr:ABC transporter permease [Gemmatimonadales bacterium]